MDKKLTESVIRLVQDIQFPDDDFDYKHLDPEELNDLGSGVKFEEVPF